MRWLPPQLTSCFVFVVYLLLTYIYKYTLKTKQSQEVIFNSFSNSTWISADSLRPVRLQYPCEALNTSPSIVILIRFFFSTVLFVMIRVYTNNEGCQQQSKVYFLPPHFAKGDLIPKFACGYY